MNNLPQENLHPVHQETTLNPNQRELLDLFFETEISDDILRRETLPGGRFRLFTTTRLTRPFDFPVDETEFALKIHESEKPDAPLSPFYINPKNLPGTVLEKVGKVLADVDLGDRPDFCAGIPSTATAMNRNYSDTSGIPPADIFERVGTDTKGGIEAKKDAPRGDGKNIIIIDDVVAHGITKFQAIKAAEELGYKVAGLLMLVDREQGGAEELEKAGYKVYHAFKVSDIIKYYFESGKITQDQYDKAIAYIISNKK